MDFNQLWSHFCFPYKITHEIVLELHVVMVAQVCVHLFYGMRVICQFK